MDKKITNLFWARPGKTNTVERNYLHMSCAPGHHMNTSTATDFLRDLEKLVEKYEAKLIASN